MNTNEPDCTRCENPHDYGTPCVDPLMKGPRTRRVRIAVVTTNCDEWSAYGHAGASDSGLSDCALDMTSGEPYRISFIEADVPLPEPAATIEADCVEVKP